MFKKDVLAALQWIAAEFKYLQQLYKDLHLIEVKGNLRAEIRVYRKAKRLLRYISRCEAKSVKYIDIVKEEVQTHPLLRRHLAEINIAERKLIRAFSLYSGEFSNDLKEIGRTLRFKIYFKNTSKEVNDAVTRVKILLKDIEDKVEDLMTWTQGLDALLQRLQSEEVDLSRRDAVRKLALGTAGVALGVALPRRSSAQEKEASDLELYKAGKYEALGRRIETRLRAKDTTSANDREGLLERLRMAEAYYQAWLKNENNLGNLSMAQSNFSYLSNRSEKGLEDIRCAAIIRKYEIFLKTDSEASNAPKHVTFKVTQGHRQLLVAEYGQEGVRKGEDLLDAKVLYRD